VKAGADVIETNTFGANRIKLASFGLGDKVQAINTEGARIAREACGGRAYVAGAIGPLGIRIEPWGRVGVDEAQEYFREQAEALAAGRRRPIIETFRDLNEIRAAVAAVRSVCALPVVAQMTTEEDGSSLDGTPPEEFAPALVETGADVIGLNCSVGPAPLLESIERMAGVTRARLSVQPNAGKPRDIEGRTIYLSSPEYMASTRGGSSRKACSGGCRRATIGIRMPCGCSPGQAWWAGSGPAACGRARSLRPGAPRAQIPPAHELARGVFVVLAEPEPPRVRLRDPRQARTLKIRGVDAINAPDTPRARDGERAGHGDLQHGGVETCCTRPRPQPARHAIGPAGRTRDGPPQPARHHREPADRRRLPAGHRRVRRGFDRPRQRRHAAQPRARRRRRLGRCPDRFPPGRGGQPDRAGH
jgi:homocysteine S-methyltransferase